MSTRVFAFGVGFVVALLGGCTEYWVKPGSGPQEFEIMKASCESRSFSQFPPAMQDVQITAGYTTPIQTNCSGFGYAVSCYQTGGNYVPPISLPVDMNNGARNSAQRACFYENGWKPAEKR